MESDKKYTVVPKWWTNVLTGLVIASVFANLVLAVIVIQNQEPIRKANEMNDVYDERAKAIGDLIHRRAEISTFSYNKACAYARSVGETCLVNPTWWVNPKDYPLLKQHPKLGEGLFGPKEVCCMEEQ